MKKNLRLLFILICITFSSSAQNYRLWATYYGGADQDAGYKITTDASGNVYMTGQTGSATGIATAGAFQNTYGGGVDAYLVKFDGAGNRLWATYYGGPGADFGYGVKTDASGNVYLTGYTESTSGIATAGAFQTTYGGSNDAFLVKFDAAGNRLWATYYGGSFFDQGTNLATDVSGNVYMAGYTSSSNDISSAGAHQITYGGGGADAFIVKFNSSGVRQWGTFYGGSNEDYAFDIATDGAGDVAVGGYTTSSNDIATGGGFQNSYGGLQDAFIVKFNSAGTRLWGSYYGGSQLEYCFGITTGPGNCIYMSGQTQSTSGIASGGHQNTFGGFSDAYLVKFDASGNRIWGTYYGGTGIEEGTNVAADAFGNVFLAGDSYSPNVGNTMSTPYGYQTNLIGSENLFMVAFTSSGVRVSATYYGKNHEEEAKVAVNVFGDVYLCGWTPSTTGMVSAGSHQTTYGGGLHDAILVKFATAVPHEEVIVPIDSFPPSPTNTPPKILVSTGIYVGGGITISNCVLKDFSPGKLLPTSGTAIIPFTCTMTANYSNGGPAIAFSTVANLTVKVTYASTTGTARSYDAEILQFDAAKDSAAVKITLRESPTLFSGGSIIVTPSGSGTFYMSSFFDLYTELSVDYGANWTVSTSPYGRLNLTDGTTTSIPTLGEWGLISLSVLMIGFGIYALKNKGI